MSNSHYIETLSEVNAELPVESVNAQLSGIYGSIVDLITAGNRGQGFTWALNGADLSTDPVALQEAYRADKQAINNYLQHVDIDKIVQMITSPAEPEQPYSIPWFKARVPAFLIGTGLGIAGIALFNNLKSKSN